MASRSFDDWADALADHIHKKENNKNIIKSPIQLTIVPANTISTASVSSYLKMIPLEDRRRFIATLIDLSIVWDDTPEGMYYWGDIFNKVIGR